MGTTPIASPTWPPPASWTDAERSFELVDVTSARGLSPQHPQGTLYLPTRVPGADSDTPFPDLAPQIPQTRPSRLAHRLRHIYHLSQEAEGGRHAICIWWHPSSAVRSRGRASGHPVSPPLSRRLTPPLGCTCRCSQLHGRAARSPAMLDGCHRQASWRATHKAGVWRATSCRHFSSRDEILALHGATRCREVSCIRVERRVRSQGLSDPRCNWSGLTR